MEQATTIEQVMDGGSPGIGIQAGDASRRKGRPKRTALGVLAVPGLAAGAHYGAAYWQTPTAFWLPPTTRMCRRTTLAPITNSSRGSASALIHTMPPPRR